MKRLLIFLFLLTALSFGLFNTKVLAAEPAGCTRGIPDDCKDSKDYTPDFSCINSKIFNPSISCCDNKCNNNTDPNTTDPFLDQYREFGILGIKVKITPDSIAPLINIALSTFLGIIALYALFRGIYVAAIKRTQATDEESIKSVSKELTSIVIAFVLAFSFIFIIQIVFNVLGLKKITDFNVKFDGSDPGGPQIVINSGAST